MMPPPTASLRRHPEAGRVGSIVKQSSQDRLLPVCRQFGRWWREARLSIL